MDNHNDKLITNKNLENEKLKLPLDEVGNKKYFTSNENSKVSMYASHPPSSLREASAKNPFIKSEIDNRSSWLLFDNKDKIQEQLTLLVYEKYLNKKPNSFVSNEEFDAFLETETLEDSFDDIYEGTFQNRFINIPSFDNLSTFENQYSINELKDRLRGLMIPVKEIEKLLIECNEIVSGTTKQKELEYKGVKYTKKNIQTIFDILISDRENLFNDEFPKWDKDFISFFYFKSKEKGREQLFLKYYKQHKRIVEFFQLVLATKSNTIYEINKLQQMGDVTQQVVDMLSNDIKASVKNINEKIEEFDIGEFVALPNINSKTELKNALVEDGKFKEYLGRMFENNKINILLAELDNALASCNRVEKKSLVSILKFQEELL